MPAPALPPQCQGTHSLWDPLPEVCLQTIDTDRPHQTDTPHVIPAGHTQVESALAELALGGTLGAPPGERAAHVVLFADAYKFGVVSHVEGEVAFKHAEYVPASGRFAPPGPVSARVKWSFVEGGGWVPALTFVPWVFVPVAPSQSLRAGPLLFAGWELGERLELEVNVGTLLSTRPKPPVALVAASALTLTLVGTLRVFVDAYTTGEDAALGTGALLALGRDVQVDAGTYVGLSGEEPVATPFLGLSVRR